jgi:hypothetical protein
LALSAAAIALSGVLVAAGAASASASRVGAAYQRDSGRAATLEVAVTDLPAKAAGSVRVTGAHGYRRTIRATTILSGLAPGNYAIAASPIVVDGTTYVPTVTGAAQRLKAGARATSTAAYDTQVPATTVALAGSAVASVKAAGNVETITLTAASHVRKGDVIAVDAGTRTPDGLLAKVTAVKGRVLTATPASLQQAVPRGQFTTSAAGPAGSSSAASRTQAAAGARPGRAAASTSLKCGASGTVRATVERDVTPHLTMAAQWGGPGGTQIVADLAVTGTMGVTASVTAGAKCDLDISLNPLDLAVRRVKILNALKLVIRPTLTPYIKAAVESDAPETLSAEVRLSGSVELVYRDGAFQVTDGLTESPSYTPPHADGTASVELTPGLRAGLNVSLAGSVDANVDAGPRLETAKDGLPAWALGGLVRAGLSVDILGAKKSDEALLSKTFPIAHAASATTGSLGGLSCPSATVCEATGGLGLAPPGGGEVFKPALLRSTDAGALWAPQTPPEGIVETDGIACPTPQRCYVVASSDSEAYVLGTSDGGSSWTETPVGSIDSSIGEIACPTASHCVAVGQDVIVVTTDGGTDWTSVATPAGMEGVNVTCPTAAVCLVTGGLTPTGSDIPNAAVMRSTNGGLTWTLTKLDAQGVLDGISCASAHECVAVGANVAARTVNGTSWTYITLPATEEQTDVSCPTAKVCVAVGGPDSGGVVRSVNAGETWAAEPVPDGAAGLPTAIVCRTASACEVVGAYMKESGGNVGILAASTAKSGAEWQEQLP